MDKKTKGDPTAIGEMMLDNIVGLGRYAFELEEKREESLLAQAGQMLTALSVYLAAIFMALPVLTDTFSPLRGDLVTCALILSAMLIVCFVLVIQAQWRYAYRSMVSIEELAQAVEDDYRAYLGKSGFYHQWIYQVGELHRSKKRNNDRRARSLVAAMTLFVSALVLVPVYGCLMLYLHL